MLDSPLPCIACGTVNPAQALFCFTCGQPLHASATASTTLTGLLTADHLLKQRYRIFLRKLAQAALAPSTKRRIRSLVPVSWPSRK